MRRIRSTRKEIAIDGFSKTQNCDCVFTEAAGDEIIQIEFFERAADRIRFLDSSPRRFEEQAAARKRRPFGVEEAQIERRFEAQTHRA